MANSNRRASGDNIDFFDVIGGPGGLAFISDRFDNRKTVEAERFSDSIPEEVQNDRCFQDDCNDGSITRQENNSDDATIPIATVGRNSLKYHLQILAVSLTISLVLSTIWVLLFFKWTQSAQQPKVSTIKVSKVEPQSFSVEPTYYVASEIGKVYHNPDCFYAKQQTKHVIKFLTRENAEATSRKPCTNCLRKD